VEIFLKPSSQLFHENCEILRFFKSLSNLVFIVLCEEPRITYIGINTTTSDFFVSADYYQLGVEFHVGGCCMQCNHMGRSQVDTLSSTIPTGTT
jgi:hypothetical protein